MQSLTLKKIDLTNYKKFSRYSCYFAPNFNAIVGVNASGKTSLLDAVTSLHRVFSLLNGGLNEKLHEKVKKSLVDVDGLQRFEPAGSVSVEISLDIDFETTKQNFTEYHQGGEIRNTLDWIVEQAVSDSKSTMPLVLSYPASRTPSDQIAGPEFKITASRVDVWRQCHLASRRFYEISQWFDKVQRVAEQENRDVGILKAVQDALATCMLHWKKAYYKASLEELVATLDNGDEIPLPVMSDGIRSMFSLVADIARRAAMLNPHLGEAAAFETPGIIVIDELDLHLHPGWQRRISHDLRKTFPKMQFIVATHSPFIIQSLKEGELINLDENVGEHADQPLDVVLADVMGIPQPNRTLNEIRKEEAAEKYFEYLEAAKRNPPADQEAFESELDALVAEFADDPAYIAFLNVKRRAAMREVGK